MDINIILEILLGGSSAGLLFAILRRLKKSGCLVKKEPNSCACDIITDIDGDGVNDVEVKIGSVNNI